MTRKVHLGLLGLGTVGSGLVEIIKKNATSIESKSGVQLEIVKALIKDTNKPRLLDTTLLTTQFEEVINHPKVDIVVEVMGGIDPAKDYILKALKNGKNVVTANKAVLAHHGAELFSQARDSGTQLAFEASVCGGIPIIRALSSGMIANEVEELCGILNGTSNYILSKMHSDHLTFEQSLKQAQEQGLAEEDPTFDVEGIDASHKLIVLTELTFQVKATLDDLEREGITKIQPIDIQVADEFGFVIKPVALTKRHGHSLEMRVHPSLVPYTHPLGPVNDEFNAVMVKGDATGEMIFHGKGAGSLPTASAVMSDIIEIARNPKGGVIWNPTTSTKITQAGSESRYYLRFPIEDRPGLIGVIATELGNQGVSITHAQAKLHDDSGNVMIVTHPTSHKKIGEALKRISSYGVLSSEPLSLRIID